MKNEEDISSDKTENQTQERSLHITQRELILGKELRSRSEIITQIG